LKKFDFNNDCDNLDKTLYPDDTEGSGPLKCRASFFRIKVLMPAPPEFPEGSRYDSIRVKCWSASFSGPPDWFSSILFSCFKYNPQGYCFPSVESLGMSFWFE